MPQTALKVNGQNLLFMTATRKDRTDVVDVDIFVADEEFLPTGTPSIGISEHTEENYHRELRKQAKEKKQFVPEHSTNPEWNPE